MRMTTLNFHHLEEATGNLTANDKAAFGKSKYW